MSGTSLDGVDAALVKLVEKDGKLDYELIHFSTLSFSGSTKAKLYELCTPEEARIEAISAMNMYLDEVFAERTGVTTVGDFRTRDMAAGGQGDSLVPYVDYLLFREKSIGRILLNIGGITNIAMIPNDCKESDVIAYDTGPGNMVVNASVDWIINGKKSYDRDGRLAAKGNVDEQWLAFMLEHDYLNLPAPKSTVREMFGIHFTKKLWAESEKLALSDVDKIATVTELTAQTIALEINKYIKGNNIEEVLISGGWGIQHYINKRIEAYLKADVQIKLMDDYNLSADAKEAIAFAILGYQCFKKKTNNLPSATGARNDVVMGKIAW